MPRTPRNSPNPPGRPPHARRAAEQVVPAVERGEMGNEEAARVAKVSSATLRRVKTARKAAATLATGKAPAASPVRAPAAPRSGQATPLAKTAAGSQAGSGEAGKRDRLLALIRELLDGDPGLLDALPLDGSELGRRLAETEAEVAGADDLDPLAILRRVQRRLERDLTRLGPERAVERRQIGALLVVLAKGAASVMKDLPADDGPDEAQQRIMAVRDKARERILANTREQAAKLRKGREALSGWMRAWAPQAMAEEHERRVGELLGARG